MASGTRQIKTRIKSIKNTKKVTKAMQLVAAAKMRRSVERALSSRQYALWAWDMASRLSQSRSVSPDDYLRRFFQPVENPKRHLVIAFASNRGLCGAFNSNVVRKVAAFVRQVGSENVDIIIVGKRLAGPLSQLGIKPAMAFENQEQPQDASAVVDMASYAYEAFKKQSVDEVWMVYSHFVSALSQEAVLRPLFPFKKSESALTDVGTLQTHRQVAEVKGVAPEQSYLYEPDKRKVLSYLVPRLGEAQLYQALLESNASEHSARMLAMKSATDAAGDMLQDLTLQYNRARQASITQEIAELSAGIAAMT